MLTEMPTVLDEDGVFPALVSVYQNQGFERGYSRARGDMLASILEAVEEFLRENPSPSNDPRQLLYQFGEYCQEWIAQEKHADYVWDGLGI